VHLQGTSYHPYAFSSAALAGAVVKFADVVDPTICVDVSSIKHLVSDRTAVVVVVHLYGRPVDGCADLALWLHDRGIYLVEDCAHALGAVDVSGRMCGSIGDVGIYSFHQQKNMTTLGEGGACVTNSASLRESMVGLRSLCAMSYDPKGKYLSVDTAKFPMENRYWFMDFSGHGHNYRMTDVQAAVGRVQLRKLRKWNARRSEIARKLHERLGAVHPGLRPAVLDGPTGIDSSKFVHAWHIFHVLITDEFPVPKDQFMWILLHDFGIKTWNHYLPMHLASSFRADGLGRPGDCPVAEALFEQYVSLPLHPRLTDAAIDYMIDAIQQISTRSYVLRTSSTPLLSALVDFTEARKSLSSVDDSESIVSKQLTMFKSQVAGSGAQKLFSSGKPIYVSRAPGRLDLMGGNDDYTGGLVFECTIAEATFCAASRNSSDKIVVRNRQLEENDIEVPVSVLLEACLDLSTAASTLSEYIKVTFPESRWQLYVFGVLLWLQIRFPDKVFHNQEENCVCGLSLLIWTEVPLNRGVSSSASVEVAVVPQTIIF
jgi:perosamine synthetase